MRDQFAGDISDLLKFSFLRALAGRDKVLGVAWYYIPDHNKRTDGRHREFCAEDKWKVVDELTWRELCLLPERSVKALEEMRFWPNGTIFHRDEIPDFRRRIEWFQSMKDDLSGSNLIFLDPDNGLGTKGKLHAWINEVKELSARNRTIVLIKFPGRTKHVTQLESYHRQLKEQAGVKKIFSVTTKVLVPLERQIDGPPRTARIRWFTVIDADSDLMSRAEEFVTSLRKVPGTSAEIVF